MTQEFENLLELLQSPNEANVNLGLILLENYKDEFEAYFKMNLERDKELFDILIRDKYWQFKTPFDKIEDLNFSSRTTNALMMAGIKSVAGIVRKSQADLLEVEGLGEKAVEEIAEAIQKLGLSLKD